MKLEDLKPRPSKLFLSGSGKEYTLRPWTLEDQIWMNQEYGDRIKEIFTEDNIDIVAIARMAYRLLADKTDFKAQKIKEIDEDGNEVNGTIGGYKLLIHKVKGYKEQVTLMTAVLECVGLSMPQVEELKKLGDDTQKKSS